MTKVVTRRYKATRVAVWLAALVIALVCARHTLRGHQSTTGAIRGTAVTVGTDPETTRSAASFAEVVATMGKDSRRTQADRTGQFVFDNLPIGVWHVTVQATKAYRSASQDVSVGPGQMARVRIAVARAPWWEVMAGNSDSPQKAVATLVGAGARDCGQFGPGVQEFELANAIACAQDATRARKAFFAIRHHLSPEQPELADSHRWLAEGLFGRGDGMMRRFEFQGFSIHEMFTGSPPREPRMSETACAAPRPAPDPNGTVRFECAERLR